MPMNYQVLARKWRPRNFQEMVGQEPILRMLTNALASQRLHHAYLFAGMRGVGKTSVARIFAKCLNCETGVTATPCGTCKTCQAIDAGNFLDLIEVDAASRTRVEDTRELLENVQYPAAQGRYKIYLIDEVHMLSGHSFNALLKTLEEPPAHVKFLLATTDPKRLPITILSRCLQFNLSRVAPDKIIQQLTHICTQENILFDAAALALLAQAADGSMRDALSLLDQAIAYCGERLTAAEIQQMLGTVEQEAIFRLLSALADRNGPQLLQEITQLAEQSPNFSQILEELLSILHQLAIAHVLPPTVERIQQLISRFTAEDVQLYYQIGLIGRRDLTLAPTPQQGFEMTLLRMLAFHPVSSASIPNAPAPVAATPITPPSTLAATTENWSAILAKLELNGMALALASHCEFVQLIDNKLELLLATKHTPLLNKNLLERIEQALCRYFNRPIQLSIKSAANELATPAKQQEEAQLIRQQQAAATIQNDVHVKKMIDLFDAKLDIDSIKSIDPMET